MEISKTDIEKIIHFVPGDVAVYQYDGGLQTLYYSAGRPAVLGFANDEYNVLTSGDALDIVFKEDRPLLKKQILACLDGTRESECTYRIFHKDKGFFWVHARAKRIGEMDGCPVILVVLIDASTETKLYEVLLKNSETRVFVIDRKNLSLLYTNSPAFGGRECLNYTDYTCYNYIQCRDKVCDDCFLKDVRSGETLTTKRTVSSEGRIYSVRTSAVNWYGHDAFVQFVEDITERSLAQKKLESKKADLEALISNMPIGLCIFRTQAGVLRCESANAYFCRLIGVGEGTLEGKELSSFAEYIAEGDRPLLSEISLAHIRSKGSLSGTLHVRIQGKEVGPIHVEGRLLTAADDSVVTLFGCSAAPPLND